jgi:hypothetical protein
MYGIERKRKFETRPSRLIERDLSILFANPAINELFDYAVCLKTEAYYTELFRRYPIV